MKKFISSIVSFTLFFSFYFPLIVFGSTVIIFDTRQYDKGKGKPITYTDTFSTRDSSAQYTLHVWQGQNGQNMAKSGNISLNGVEVVSARELRNGTGGVPPLDVFFMIDTNITSPIVSYNVDFDDDGIDDYSQDNADNISFTYNTEGIYYVKATVIDNQNNTYTDTKPLM